MEHGIIKMFVLLIFELIPRLLVDLNKLPSMLHSVHGLYMYMSHTVCGKILAT